MNIIYVYNIDKYRKIQLVCIVVRFFQCIKFHQIFNILNVLDIFSFPKVRANEINLGDMAVYTSNVGIQVLYRCEYPTNVDISSQAFDVQVKGYN